MLEAIFILIGYCIMWGITSITLMFISDDDEDGVLVVLAGLIWPIIVPIFLGLAIGCGIVYLVCYLLFDVIGL